PLLEKLIQLVFLYLLRQYLVEDGQLTGLGELARSGQFSGLLNKLIAHPEQPWTLASMAVEVGLSRSAFFKRFCELSPVSPGQVVLALRMRKARQLLAKNLSVAEVAPA